jgi:hypothetical protein
VSQKEEIWNEHHGGSANLKYPSDLRSPRGRIREVLKASDTGYAGEARILEGQMLAVCGDYGRTWETRPRRLHSDLRDIYACDVEAAFAGVFEKFALTAGDIKQSIAMSSIEQPDEPRKKASLAWIQALSFMAAAALLMPVVVPVLELLESHVASGAREV